MIPLFDTLEHIKENIQKYRGNNEDFRYANEFLYSYRGSDATFTAYRREIERFLQWCAHIVKKNLKEIRRVDFESYIEFCQHPPRDWIATQNYPRFLEKNGERKPNPLWRPFVVAVKKTAREKGETPEIKKYFLSQKALQSMFAIIGSFYNYLVQEEYVNLNPVAQVRQKSKFIRKKQHKMVIRRLSELQWSYVIETAEKMAAEHPAQHERTLFMMSILFGMYLRISELAASERWQPKMGDFQQDHDGNWWFITVGKGNKERMITVSDSVLSALKRYRSSLNLSSLPSPGETTPLFSKQLGAGAITSTRQIRSLVQDCFDRAISRLEKDGFHEEAEQMKAATVHWLRHTGISEDVKHRPREHVRDDAGHSSSAITDRYIDVELRARHASGKKKWIKPE